MSCECTNDTLVVAMGDLTAKTSELVEAAKALRSQQLEIIERLNVHGQWLEQHHKAINTLKEKPHATA